MSTQKVMVNGSRKYTVNITGSFTGDGSADLTDHIAVDRSTLIGPEGVAPNKIRIDAITWAVGIGYDAVEVAWKDDAGDEVIEYLQGQGYMDYRPSGGKSTSLAPTVATDGDIVLTTTGGAAGDTYSILLECSLKN